MPTFNKSSLDKLNTCDPKLIKLFTEIVKYFDCTILQGYRTPEEQLKCYNAGTSKLKFGNHNLQPSHAVDVAPYPVDLGDVGTKEKRIEALKRIYLFSGYVLGVADQLGISIRWGGDWDSDTRIDDQTFNDLVHFEISSPK